MKHKQIIMTTMKQTLNSHKNFHCCGYLHKLAKSELIYEGVSKSSWTQL